MQSSSNKTEQDDLPLALEDLWRIGERLGSLPQGECYEASSRDSDTEGVVWLTRRSLNHSEAKLFLEHVAKLLSIRNWCNRNAEVSYGVDRNQRGYVAISRGVVFPIDYDNPGIITRRNRYLMCLALIAELHRVGSCCGNLTKDSFAVDSLGIVYFRGFLGGYAEPISADLPVNIRYFFRDDLKALGQPSKAADITSLAVLGLQLFGADLPPVFLNSKGLANNWRGVFVDSPPWILAVLTTVLRTDGRRVCRSAEQLLGFIDLSDRGYLKSLTVEGITAGVNKFERPLSLDEVRCLYLSPSELRRRRFELFIQSRRFKSFLALVVMLVAIPSAITIYGGLSSYISKARASYREGNSPYEIFLQVASSLLKLRELRWGNDEASGNDYLGSEVEHLLKRITKFKRARNEAQVGESDNRIELALSADHPILEGVINRTLGLEDIHSILSVYSDLDIHSRVYLHLAFIRAGGELELRYRETLVSLLNGSVLGSGINLNSLSIDALFACYQSEMSGESFKLWGGCERLSDSELVLVSELHARRRSAIFRELADVLTKRGIVSGFNSLFLQIATKAEQISGPPYAALLSAASGRLSIVEVEHFSVWSNPLSRLALYGVLHLSSDKELCKRSLAALFGKGGLEVGVRELIEFLLNRDPQANVVGARLVAAVGLGESAPKGSLKVALDSALGDKRYVGVLELLVERAPSWVAVETLKLFGDRISPDEMTAVLSRPEPEVRLAVAPFLKAVTLASSRVRIREYLERERDPNVRAELERVVFAW
jgi:hypothetical protein